MTSNGAIPLTLGGDHTIAWPDAAGVAQHLGQGRVSMIHFDAHADTGNITFGSLIGHGQPMRRLIESGRCGVTGSCRSGCAATGPSQRR
ncbi:arginase family protein [Nonomuraea dietziae]|uniref:arginase family protein n=1 Tax=Nonomuraea dietziae TaxID=65515 RepID=UPI0031DC275C